MLFRVLYLRIRILDFNAGQNLGMSQYEARLELKKKSFGYWFKHCYFGREKPTEKVLLGK